MRKSIGLRLLAAVLLGLAMFQTFVHMTKDAREQKKHVALFASILQNERFSKEETCEAYFTTLASNLESLSSIADNGAKKTWIRSHIAHIRAYGACFLTGSTDMSSSTISDIEEKLFPLFSGDQPKIKSWNGTTLPQRGRVLNSFWGNRQTSFSGKGIVISISDGGFAEATRLLRVLRLLGNELPIEFVHRGDLSQRAMSDLVKTARSNEPPYFNEPMRTPPQEVYFVDVRQAISEGNAGRFLRFSNKWLAALFSTFDEMILMDSDVVPFLNPVELFDLDSYKTDGALFFRDRFTTERTWTTPMSFFRELHPSEEEMRAFGLKDYRSVAESTGFFESKAKHVMESGMVVMKRSTHFSGLLISAAMQFWQETSGPFYGDKELFWLGQVYAGNGAFSFNSRGAAALGSLKKSRKSWEVCSTQPAQFDDAGRLLWANGGLQQCKKGYYKKDYSALKSLREQFSTPEELHKYYQSPLNITGAIIPKRKKDFTQNKSKGCIGYVWCAAVHKGEEDGSLIEFTDEQRTHIQRVEQLWFGDDYIIQ